MSILRWSRTVAVRTAALAAAAAAMAACGSGDDNGPPPGPADASADALPYDGSVTISVTLQPCPRVTSLTATPLSAPIGGGISVTATSTTPDAGRVVLRWSAPSGRFDDVQSAATTFTCTDAGPVPLTVTAVYGYCMDSESVPVSCRGM